MRESNNRVSILRRTQERSTHFKLFKGLIRDSRLSPRARCILVYILSHSDSWEVRFDDLKANGFGGRSALREAFKEMLKYGYAHRVAIKDPKTKNWIGCRYLVQEDSEVNTPEVSFFAPSEKRHLKNSSYSLRKINPARQAGRGLFGFDLGEESCSTTAQKLTHVFAKWTIKHRLHSGRLGSTSSGWTPRTIKNWTRAGQHLLDQFDGDTTEIKKVLKWYFEHWQDDYVPQCHTLKSFCAKFSNLQDAIRRSEKPKQRNGNGAHAEEEYTGFGEGPTPLQWENIRKHGHAG